MKLSKIALATSLAVASFGVNAATGIPATSPVFYISGASGVDNYMGPTISSMLNVTKYIAEATTSPSYQGWYGTLKVSLGTLASGTNVLIMKRSAGGSAMGVIPLARGSKIETLDWANGSATAYSTTGGVSNYVVPVTSAANGLVPDIGVSDVEPAMFSGINTEANLTPLTAAEQLKLTSKSWALLAMGIAVTKNVSDTANITNNWVREVMSGHYQDWSKADGTKDPVVICRRIEGSGTQAAFNSYFSGFPNTLSFNGFGKNGIAKMTDSTNADYGVKSDVGTGDKTSPYVIIPTDGAGNLAFTVFEAYASGDAKKCMEGAQFGRDALVQGPADKANPSGAYYNIQFSKVGNENNITGYGGGTSKAIGVLSLDSYTSNSTGTNIGIVAGKGYGTGTGDASGAWTYRYLNGKGTYDVKNQVPTGTTSTAGIAPSRDNILTGYYDFLVEPTIQYRNAAVGDAPATSANGVLLWTAIKEKLADPADMLNVAGVSNSAPLAYSASPELYTKSTTSPRHLVNDLTRQGNTTSPLHATQ